MATQNYHTIKNAALITPATVTDLGSVSQPYGNLYLQGNLNLGSTAITSTSSVVPKISSLAYLGSATAADIAGGQTITINGTGFLPGISAYIAGNILGATNLVSSTQVTFTSPAKTAGSYTLSVVNTDGGSASYVAGLTYSALPVWSTAAGSLGTGIVGTTISTITLSASENAQTITYAVTSGSLPGGLSLSSSGAITGTLTGSSTTYNFTITATDPQNQTASRNFSYTTSVVYMSATGGTVTPVGNYKIHTFTSSGTFTVTSAPANSSVQYVVVAGGGGGGIYGGGGGAGGYLTGTTTVTATSYTVTVGAGGAISTDQNYGSAMPRQLGSASVFGSTTAPGGGGGGNNNTAGGNGGSGGGAGRTGSSYSTKAGGIGSAGSNGGSTVSNNNSGAASGGGGGAGGAGGSVTNPNSQDGGAGGVGIVNPISGSTTGQYDSGTGSYYLAGGGAGDSNSNATILGAKGGGGRTGGTSAANAYDGLQNTGGGGGGGNGNQGGLVGAGGSGVVIISYQYQ
jgi:hypothetical protein